MGTDPSITIFLVAASSLIKKEEDYITKLDELKHFLRIYAVFFLGGGIPNIWHGMDIFNKNIFSA